MIGTSAAASHTRCVFQVDDVIKGEHRCCFACITVTGDQCSTKSTHDAGDVRTNSLAAGNQFKASQYGIIVEGTALYNDFLAQILRICQFDNLQQCILDNGISQSGGDIADFGPFFLSLFDIGIHENGTSGTKVNRMFGKNGNLCKVFHGIIQRMGECFDERAASRGTCFV